MKQSIALLWANYRRKVIMNASLQATHCQARILDNMLSIARTLSFGKEHHLSDVRSYEEFKQAVPLRDYEKFAPYIERIRMGEENVLWEGVPLYWAKTSGTTSGTKYIPITKASLPNHIGTAKDALFCYMATKRNASILDGKMIFLSGSPKMEKDRHIAMGRLSGIVHNHVPSYLQSNRLPSYATNCIVDWETKLDAIVEETLNQDMRLISGIPPWVQMYFDRLAQRSGKKIKQLFPHFSLFVHGGVNIKPYQQKLREIIGDSVDWLETFPASEGFLAYQDSQERDDLLLNTNSGIFFEFVPLQDMGTANPRRYNLEQVSLGQAYALLLSTNAGLWAYDIGDVVEFTSLSPYRIVVKGRTKQYISAFGEHVIAEEVEYAMMQASKECGAVVTEFTVAPCIDQGNKSNSYHEWFVEFEQLPPDIHKMAKRVDELLCSRNSYYQDLIKGKIIAPLQLRTVPKDTFIRYMKSIGKLGEQHKVPHLKNDRTMVDHDLFRQ